MFMRLRAVGDVIALDQRGVELVCPGSLRADRLNLVAISYGTHLALTYIRRYPHRVHRATLHGIEGPDHTWKSPAEINRVLHRIEPAIAGVVEALTQRLETQPATVAVDDVRVTVGADDLRRAVFFAIRRREDIAEIPARLRPMLRGDYTPLARWALRTRRENREQVMAVSMDCASGYPTPDARALSARRRPPSLAVSRT